MNDPFAPPVALAEAGTIAGDAPITVFLSTYNGADIVGDCLDAVAASRVTFPFEIVVVDDASTDGSAAVVEAAFGRFPAHVRGTLIRHARNEGVGAAHARASAAARTPFVASLGDDCFPAPDWLARVVADWRSVDPGVMGIGGQIVARTHDTLNRRYLAVRDPHRPLEIAFARRRGFLHRLLLAARHPGGVGVRPAYALVGGDMSLRRSALEAIGGFDPTIRFGGPETDVCLRIRARFGDSCLLIDPALVVAHEYEPDLRSTFRRAWRAGGAAGRDWVRHGGLPSVRPGPGLLAVAALAGAPLGRAASVGGIAATAAWLYRDLLRPGHPESAVYPALAIAEEVVADLGTLAGAVRHRGAAARGSARASA